MTKSLERALFALFVSLAGGLTAGATTPANDVCADAISISLGDTPYSNAGASSSFPEGLQSAENYIGADIWYSFEAPANGTVTLSMEGSDPCDDPLEFDPPLDSPTVVECLDELPTECDATQGATRGVVSCGLSSDVQSRTVCTATTAMGTGPDGAIALFDIDGDGTDDRFFVPTGAGLTLTQFENGVAIVSGQVEDVDDPTAILDVNIFYDNGVSGADWTGGYKTDMSCMIPVTGNATTDEWSIYLLNSGLSFLTGSGSLDGTTLQLTHAPSTEYFGFQVGESANDRNCNYGAGGWFAYEGFLNGSAIQGGTGDVLLDLECSEEINNDCGDQESTVTLYYAAFDADCGDVIQGSETYSREDMEGPEFVNPPQDMEVACTDWYLAVPTVTVTDNCEDSDAVAPTVTFEEDTIAQTGSGCLTVVRSWTAEDCSGNQTGHQQVITVVDNNGPTITGGADYEAQCDGDGNPDELSMWLSSNGGASATDDCGTVSWSHDYTDGDLSDGCGATGTVDVTFTAADDCGNESDITLTFTIVDVTAPTLNVTLAVDVACETYSATGIYGATATDICGDATVELVSVTDLSSGCPQYLHVYKAVDDCGNESATIDQVVSLVDEEDPVVNITCPANYAAYLDGDCLTDISPAAAGTATATATDNCSTPAPTVTYSDGTPTPGCGSNYSFVRTWSATAEDECGNSTTVTCDQTITVSDEIDPVITCPANVTVECDGMGNAADLATFLAGASATDNCDMDVDITNDYTALSNGCGATGSATVIFTATDDCGNTSTCSATFTITDTTNPSIDTDASNETVECDGSGNTAALNAWLADNGGAEASDVCGGVTWTNNHSALSDDCGATGSTTVTFTATDDCGNASSTQATFTIEDTTAPEWDEYAVYAYAACEDVLDPTDPTLVPITASDDCGSVTYSIEAYQLSGGCPGTWMRVWTATDECGNESVEADQYLQLYDIIKPVPVITCPADYTVSADGDCEADTTPTAAGEATATATDNCDDDVDIVITYADGEVTDVCEGSYSFTRTWTAMATDDCDNVETNSCDQLITVNDDTAPEISGGADETVECDGSGNSDELTTWLNSNGGATATDNCSEITWSHNYTDCDGGLGMFTTFRQGDWGNSNSNNPAAGALDSDFDSVFPDGVSVGCGDGFELVFTTADAVDTYLPCTGGAQDLVLTHGGVNPTEAAVDPTCWDNALVSQLLTAKLNVAFDAADPSFSASDVAVGDLIIQDGPFYGMSISDVIEISDGVLGDCRNDYTPQQCRVALRAFNKNYDDGTDNLGFMQIAGCFTDECAATGQAIVTFTATDDCENSSSVTLTFTIEDTTAPMISGDPVASVSCDEWMCDAEALEELGIFTVSEDCGDYTMTISCNAQSGDCVTPIPAYDITVTATDECGNESAQFMQIVNLYDDEDPVPSISCPADYATTADASCMADVTPAVAGEATGTATDNCDSAPEVTITYSDGPTTSTCEGSYSFTRTWTATAEDHCENTASTSCEQLITVTDDTDPEISCPVNVTVECDGMGNAADLATFLAGASATDNCDTDVEITNNYMELSDGCGATGSATVTFTATDDCGNTSTCSATFTIVDTTNPDIDTAAANETVECDGAGNTAAFAAWLSNNGGATASDACGGVTWSHDSTGLSDDCGATGSETVTFTATDDCGNMSTTTATFTIEDTTSPAIDTAASNETVECDGMGNTAAFAAWLADNGGAEASDACGGVTWSHNSTGLSDDCGATGSETVTFTATDDCGNMSTSMATFTIEDTTSPDIDTAASNETVECDGMGNTAAFAAWLADNGGAEASDVCGGVTWSHNSTGLSDDCGATGSETVTFTATDDCGNTSTSTATFTIEDTTNPDIDTAASNETVECDGMGNTASFAAWLADKGGAEASDVCGGVTWSHNSTGLSDDCGATGSETVTFTATDDCGNASSTTATFTIEDTTAPEITASNEVDVPCDEYDAATAYDYAATDGCSEVTTTIEDLFFSGPCEGSYQRTYTATDACGNSSQFVQIINLTDEEAPTFTIACPADVTLSADEDCNADTSVETNGTATFDDVADNCDADVEMTVTHEDATSSPCDGSTVITRTFTITGEDNCGNTTTLTCDQTITVNDDTAPSITAPANATVECDGMGNEADLAAFLSGATATDNCSDVTIEHDFTALSDDCGATGSATVTFTATDACGNSSSASATFTIEDTTAPSIDTAADNETVECDGMGNVLDYLTWQSAQGGAMASDACSGVTWSHEVLETGDDCGGAVGYSVVEFTATDDCGNASSTTATFTIEDTTAPEITASNEVDVPCDEYDAATAYDYAATDGCSEVTTTIEDLFFSGPCEGSYQRTYTATDACGNSSQFVQIINLTDEEAPTFTIACPADVTLSADEDCNADTSVETNGTATFDDVADNCDADVEMTVTHEDATSSPCDGSTVITRTFTITGEDNCGNITTLTCDQTITVNDDTAPSITAPANATVECDGMGNEADLAAFLSGATATDNCSDVTIEHDFTALSDLCGATGAATVTFTATDACGNSSSASATFTIEDTTAPSIDTAADNETVECDGVGNTAALNAWLADNGGAEASDACGGVTWSNNYTSLSDDCGATGSAMVTFTATDDCGNASTTTATFTIEDTTNPTIDTAALNETVECDGMGNTAALNAWLADNGGAEASDACGGVTWSNNYTALSDDCGATGSAMVTFTATDDCGNASTTTATFTIEDTTNPSIDTAADNETVECDGMGNTAALNAWLADNGGAEASDACGGVTWSHNYNSEALGPALTIDFDEEVVSDDCGATGSMTVTFTATDDCGNSSETTATFTIEDTTNPTIDTAASNETVECDGLGNTDALNAWLADNGGAEASDACSGVTWSHNHSALSDGCGATGSTTVTFTATDDCGNSSETTATFTIEDTTNPTIDTAASNETVECDGLGNTAALNAWLADNGGAEASDACGGVTWSHNHSALSDGCGATGSTTVTFTATDDCGNSSETTATFTIEDTTPPSLSIEGPANQDLEQNATCDLDTSVDALGIVTYTAGDACGSASVEITHEDGEALLTCDGDDDLLEGSYSFERTFTATATDECGLTTTATYVQTITVADNMAPQFTSTCEIANGGAVEVCCEDYSGSVVIPDPCDTEAADNCDSDVAIVYAETYMGDYAPGDGVESFCESSTPEAYADGEACNGLDSHAFSLFNFDGEPRMDFISVGAGVVAQMTDGSWVLTQELVNAAGTGGLSLSVTYGAALGWDDWSNQEFPTGYKRDCGELIDDHENWDYRILQSGTLTGTGNYTGLALSLSHAPANEYYALQVGLGANNQNNNYGYSGWIMASGMNGEDAVMFSGDVFGDLDCCLPWSIHREYTATDDCGNDTDFAYNINVNGEDCEDGDDANLSGGQSGDHTPVILGGSGDLTSGKTPIRVTNLQPNPANDWSLLGFEVADNMRIRIDLVTMQGVMVAELYDGVASPNVNHTLNIDTESLSNGMYQIRLSSSQYLVVKKLLVTE